MYHLSNSPEGFLGGALRAPSKHFTKAKPAGTDLIDLRSGFDYLKQESIYEPTRVVRIDFALRSKRYYCIVC